MTPASLRANYISELKKCGDLLYKKNQYWEFIPVLTKSDPMLQSLSAKVFSRDAFDDIGNYSPKFKKIMEKVNDIKLFPLLLIKSCFDIDKAV